MDNLNTHYTFELCQYLGRLSGVWETRPPLTTGAQRRAFLTDPSHKHVVHYTPKHGSWLNQVEIWFGVLCRRLLQQGVPVGGGVGRADPGVHRLLRPS